MTRFSPDGSDTTDTTTLPFKPKEPDLGGLQQTSYKEWEAFCGLNGKAPNASRTGTESGDAALCLNPNQLRPIGSYGQKSQNHRQTYTGKTKIGKAVKISKMKQDVFDYLIEHGMDGICWYPDQLGTMRNIITDSEAFDTTTAGTIYQTVSKTFDAYCLSNDLDAATWLFNAMEDDLYKDVSLFLRPTSGFIVVWYEMLTNLYNSNIDRKRDLEDKIRDLNVTKYPQQDLSQFVAEALGLCEELDDMDAYNHDNSVKLLDAVSHAGGGTDPMDPNTLAFRHKIIKRREDLEERLAKIRSLSLPDQDKVLTPEGLHFRPLLQGILTEYKQALHNRKWPPATNPLDKKVPRMNLSSTEDWQKLAYSLLLQQANQKQQQSVRFNHDTHHHHDTRRQPRGGRGGRGLPPPNPRRTPPLDNAVPNDEVAGTKCFSKVFDGVKNYWCNRCRRWTVTHPTSEHKDRSSRQQTPPASPSLNTAGVRTEAMEADAASLLAQIDFSKLEFYKLSVDVPVVETVLDEAAPTNAPSTDWPADAPFMYPVTDELPSPEAPTTVATSEVADLDPSTPALLPDIDIMWDLGALPAAISPAPVSWSPLRRLIDGLLLTGLLLCPWGFFMLGSYLYPFLSLIGQSICTAGTTSLLGLSSSLASFGRHCITASRPIFAAAMTTFQTHCAPLVGRALSPAFAIASPLLSALPPYAAFHRFLLALPALLDTHLFTWPATALWLWLIVFLALAIGPATLCGPRPPIPRRIRRQLLRMNRRRPPHPPHCGHKPPYRHRAHQPSRAALLLRISQEGEDPAATSCASDTRRVFPRCLHIDFRLPNSSFHRNQQPSNRHRRRRSLSRLDLHLATLHRRATFARIYRKQQQKSDRESFLEYQRYKKAVKKVNLWEMVKEGHADSPVHSTEGPPLDHLSDCDCSSRCTESSATLDIPSPLADVPPEIQLFPAFNNIATSIVDFVSDALLTSSTDSSHLDATMEPCFEVIWDSGATVCVTNCKDDFVGTIYPPPTRNTTGIGGPIEVAGYGRVAWTFRTTNNRFRTILIPALYIPAATGRLLSTGALVKASPHEAVVQRADGMLLTTGPDAGEHPETPPIFIPYNDRNNLPTALAYRLKPDTPSDEREPRSHPDKDAPPGAPSSSDPSINTMMTALAEVSRRNVNLSEGDKEWLKWHQRLGHRAFAVIKYLMSTGTLAKSQRARSLHTQISKWTEPPKCAACCYSKAKRRPVASSSSIPQTRSGSPQLPPQG